MRMPGQIVDLKQTKRRNSRTLVPLDKTSGAARFYDRMLRDIESDLGGKRSLSRIESELVAAFAGAATQLKYLSHQILLGEGSELDLAGYSQLASTMLRLGSRLGFRRRARNVTPALTDYLRDHHPQAEEDDG